MATLPRQATLSDLLQATVTVEMTTPSEKVVTLPLKICSNARTMELNALVPDPPLPPVIDYVAADKPIYDLKDPNYVTAQRLAIIQRNSLILADMAQIDIPGETIYEKGSYVRDHFDPSVMETIAVAVNGIRQRAVARVVTRAELEAA